MSSSSCEGSLSVGCRPAASRVRQKVKNSRNAHQAAVSPSDRATGPVGWPRHAVTSRRPRLVPAAGVESALAAGTVALPAMAGATNFGAYGQRGDGRAVAGQVGAGAAADLEHVAGRPGEQLLLVGAQPGLLGSRHLAVVGQGKEPCA
jgi:hypothetical protein